MSLSQQHIRVAVVGAEGRMGSMLIKFIAQNKKVFLGAALVRKGSNVVGTDVGELVGIHPLNIMVTDDIVNVLNTFDILIDFTTPKSTESFLLICKKHKKSMIIGTTGFNEIAKKFIQEISQDIPIVFSENFSIGMNLIYKLLVTTAKLIGEYSDIKIIERHHKEKIDIPSGTALKIKEIINKNIAVNSQSSIIDVSEVSSHENRKKKINVISIRTRDVVGEHKVIFSTIDERVEINHKVFNRMIFMHGIIKACFWLKEKKSGLYSMKDVLNI
ncbi:MAG: 4-hydroxy-tetrahydrodipicolinate reductase [Arsenophonus sp.]|nr:MAG: 4-hydroxy-tetrahydrodipicolinate reductase [Arsenophonus sp.]